MKAVWHGNDWSGVTVGADYFLISKSGLFKLRIGSIGLGQKERKCSNDRISHRERRNLAKTLRLGGPRRFPSR